MTQQITYSGMIWLLVAQLVVMLPFTLNLPFWLLPVLLLSAGWRLWVLAGAAPQPGKLVKLLLLGAGVGGLATSGLHFPSLEAMSALLLLGFAFKALEAIQRRDALVVIFIGYFLVALHFLYAQSLMAGMHGVFSLVILTAALVGIQQTINEFSVWESVQFNLRMAGMMLLLSLPLMVLLFVFTPRLQPLWTLPMMTEQAKTGVSDHMTPGDIANLSQSDVLAFRVTFKGEKPPQNLLYWRGLVLNHFDGQEWRQFKERYDPQQLADVVRNEYAFNPQRIQAQGSPIEYEAIYEKSGQPWLFTLSPTVQASGDVVQAADYRVMALQDINSPFLLKAVSYPQSQYDVQLPPMLRQLALQLPEQDNPRSRKLAQRLWLETGSTQMYIDKVLARFREQAFHYTLHPPVLGDTDTVDGFLFDSQRGFCAHYAGSFVFLMRAVGIPARVVTGYQGGEWNADGHYLAIHQYDAHAWAEVWQAGKGWVQIDPTAAIAPERVEHGLEAAVQSEGSFLENKLLNTRHITWLNSLRRQLDAVQYGWQRWVLGYDSDTQLDFLQKLLGETDWLKAGGILLGLSGSIVLVWLVILGLLRRGEHETLEHRLYRRFCQRLEKDGVIRECGQTPSAFATQAALALPDKSGIIREFTAAYETLCYLPEASHNTRHLQDLLKKLR